jgi:Holliday junction resolvase
MSQRKGKVIERELVALHKQIGVHAERYPLSGASRFRGAGHDIDVYANGRDAAPLVGECKARKDGAGFTTLETWLCLYALSAVSTSAAGRRRRRNELS